jgi:hypothetical protein
VAVPENRSFDRMLGFSGIAGSDAAAGQATRIDGLTGAESNQYSQPPLTKREAAADHVAPLVTLPTRGAMSGCPPLVAQPGEPVNSGNIAGVLQAALRSDLSCVAADCAAAPLSWPHFIAMRERAAPRLAASWPSKE